jgi:hypothetical protein
MKIKTMRTFKIIPIMLHTFPAVTKPFPDSPVSLISCLLFDATINPIIPNIMPTNGINRDNTPMINDTIALLLLLLISDTYPTFFLPLYIRLLKAKDSFFVYSFIISVDSRGPLPFRLLSAKPYQSKRLAGYSAGVSQISLIHLFYGLGCVTSKSPGQIENDSFQSRFLGTFQFKSLGYQRKTIINYEIHESYQDQNRY